MAKFETLLTGNFHSVVEEMDKYILQNGLSMNLVDQSDYQLNDTYVAVRVYDKYFMRNKSRAALSVTMVSQEGRVYISAIGAGGGQGMIFNFSLGAETEMVEIVENCVNNMSV